MRPSRHPTNLPPLQHDQICAFPGFEALSAKEPVVYLRHRGRSCRQADRGVAALTPRSARPRLLTHTVPQSAISFFAFDAVEILRRRREAAIVELHGFEPVIGVTGLLGQACLDYGLQRIDGGFHTGKPAFRAVDRAE